MPSDTLTLQLQGDVPLDQFAIAIEHFNGLVKALSLEVAAGADIRWRVHELDRSSAVTTIRGESSQPQAVTRVVASYSSVGRALAEHETIPYSSAVARSALALASVLNGQIRSMVLETDETDWLIREAPAAATAEPVPLPHVAYGAITGRVQTLSNRGSLRFTLYDLLGDRAISCYVVEGREEILRDVWGKLVRVDGWISRDPINARPLTVRRITDIRLLGEYPPDHYLLARGASPSLTDLSAEAAIRRLRDA